MTRLTDVTYWTKAQGLPDVRIDENNVIYQWITGHVDMTPIRNCIEIGCFPGRYLSIFGQRGVELNGIDFIPSVTKLAALFEAKGYKTGSFHCMDFVEATFAGSFDCVYSLGFIEHFGDWEHVFRKHLPLLRPGGLVIIEVPNFRGWMQRLPRRLFDRENVRRHNLDAMNLRRWREILKDEDFEILREDYIGGYMMWFEKDCGRVERLLRRMVMRMMRALKATLYPGLKDGLEFSGAMGIIARKAGASQ